MWWPMVQEGVAPARAFLHHSGLNIQYSTLDIRHSEGRGASKGSSVELERRSAFHPVVIFTHRFFGRARNYHAKPQRFDAVRDRWRQISCRHFLTSPPLSPLSSLCALAPLRVLICTVHHAKDHGRRQPGRCLPATMKLSRKAAKAQRFDAEENDLCFLFWGT